MKIKQNIIILCIYFLFVNKKNANTKKHQKIEKSNNSNNCLQKSQQLLQYSE